MPRGRHGFLGYDPTYKTEGMRKIARYRTGEQKERKGIIVRENKEKASAGERRERTSQTH